MTAAHPRHVGEITPQWIDEILHAASAVKEPHIVAIESTVIGEGVGYLSSVARVNLTYDRPEAVQHGARRQSW